MLRTTMLAAARSPLFRAAVESGPIDPLVNRFVAGAGDDEAIAVARRLTEDRLVTVDHLGEDTTERSQAEACVAAYLTLLRRLGTEGLADRVEVSVKLSALGQSLPKDADKIALDSARQVCEAAAAVGTTVTVDMEDHTTTDRTLQTVRELRVDYPGWARWCRPCCTAPRPTAGTCPARVPGCGCARAPTPSHRRWPTRAALRSTGRTCAASRC